MSEENGKSLITETIEEKPEMIPNYKISDFKTEKILSNNTKNKNCVLVGKFPSASDVSQAILILEKKAFCDQHFNLDKKNSEVVEEDCVKSVNLFSESTTSKMEFQNDIYGNFQLFPDPEINGIKATIIFPATEKHIQKYSIRPKFIVQETPHLYKNVTLPYLEKSQFTIDWVYNILEHKQEEDRIVYEDSNEETGFILLPDLKWDGKTKETLYMLALTLKRGVKSLRDLNSTHLSLLKNIRDAGCKVIEEKYGLKRSQLRIYLHYQPSFYHLHVHFNALNNDAPGIYCEKSHLLDTVISNLELLGDYYQKITLPFILFQGSSLLGEYLPQELPEKRHLDDEKYEPSKIMKLE